MDGLGSPSYRHYPLTTSLKQRVGERGAIPYVPHSRFGLGLVVFILQLAYGLRRMVFFELRTSPLPFLFLQTSNFKLLSAFDHGSMHGGCSIVQHLKIGSHLAELIVAFADQCFGT